MQHGTMHGWVHECCGAAALIRAVAGLSRLACCICLHVVASSLCCSAYAYLACKVSYSSGTFRQHGVGWVACCGVDVRCALSLLVESCDLLLLLLMPCMSCLWSPLHSSPCCVKLCLWCIREQSTASCLGCGLVTTCVTAVVPGVTFWVQLSLPYSAANCRDALAS